MPDEALLKLQADLEAKQARIKADREAREAKGYPYVPAPLQREFFPPQAWKQDRDKDKVLDPEVLAPEVVEPPPPLPEAPLTLDETAARIAKAMHATEIPTFEQLCAYDYSKDVIHGEFWDLIEAAAGFSIQGALRPAEVDGRATFVVEFSTNTAKWPPDRAMLTAEALHQRRWTLRPRPEHFLAPLVEAWIARPVEREPNTRPGRIMPSMLAVGARGDSRTGRLFAAPLPDQGGQLYLPDLLPGATTPALPLALYELGLGDAVKNAGHSAPLALRLWVESILRADLDLRGTRRGSDWGERSVRELMRGMYPEGMPPAREWFPRLCAAVDAIQSREARIPWADPVTGKIRLWQVVSVTAIPTDADDTIRVAVNLPAGVGNGPQVSPNLAKWGVKSAPIYRALLNLAYHWHNPGRTAVPIGPRKHPHWVQVNDPGRYPVLSDVDLVGLFYPTTAKKNRRELIRRITTKGGLIDQIIDAGEARREGRKLLPPPRRGDDEEVG